MEGTALDKRVAYKYDFTGTFDTCAGLIKESPCDATEL
jgi:hypothetical protein